MYLSFLFTPCMILNSVKLGATFLHSSYTYHGTHRNRNGHINKQVMGGSMRVDGKATETMSVLNSQITS